MILSNFILAIFILFLGVLLKIYPPKNINPYYGYRTIRSIKNKENWRIANKVYSDLLMKFSFSTIFLQIIFYLFFNGLISLIIASLLWIFSIFFPIYLTEKKLKKRET